MARDASKARSDSRPSAAGRRAKGVLALLAGAVLAGCASSGAELDVRRSPGADLDDVQTFAWVQPLGTSRAGASADVTGRLKEAIGDALVERGLRLDADAPDVLVNFYVNLQVRQEVRRVQGASVPMGVPDVAGGYHDYRMGLYEPGADYDQETVLYRVGTLTIDIVDPQTKRVAWEGVAEGRVTPQSVASRDGAINRTVERLLSRFP